jgi:N-methylhydantoinase B
MTTAAAAGTSYHRPVTVFEACEALVGGPAIILAGGTDLLATQSDPLCGRSVVDLSRTHRLRGLSKTADQFVLGAMTTWADLVSGGLPSQLQGLADAAQILGSAAVRQRGTVVGNVCTASPAADGVPILLALDAVVHTASLGRERSTLLDRFVLGPGRTARQPDELVTSVSITQRAQTVSASIKLGRLPRSAFPVVNAAGVVTWDDDERIAQVAVAVGAASPVARRLRELETRLHGATREQLSSLTLQSAELSCLTPISDHRAEASHRRHWAGIAVARLLERLARPPVTI